MFSATWSSCKVLVSLRELKRESAKVYTYGFHDKSIKFIPMHHLGKAEFYEDVRKKVGELKQAGYVVFFEEVSSKINLDSLQKDTIRRKIRKIKGFNGSYEDAAKGTFLEKYVKQPSYPELGIDSNDLRADIDVLQFIQEWERVNGKIELDSLDLTTPFGGKYEKSTLYTKKQYTKVIIDYRNNYLLDLVQSSPHKKILIIYGEGHRKDFAKKLKRFAKSA